MRCGHCTCPIRAQLENYKETQAEGKYYPVGAALGGSNLDRLIEREAAEREAAAREAAAVNVVRD